MKIDCLKRYIFFHIDLHARTIVKLNLLAQFNFQLKIRFKNDKPPILCYLVIPLGTFRVWITKTMAVLFWLKKNCWWLAIFIVFLLSLKNT